MSTTATTHKFTKSTSNDTAAEGFTMTHESGFENTVLRFGVTFGEAYAFVGGAVVSATPLTKARVVGNAEVGDLFEMEGRTFRMTAFRNNGLTKEPRVRFELVEG